MNHGICKRAANRENLLGCSSFTYVFSFCVFSVILFGYVNFSIFQEAAHLMSAPAKLEIFLSGEKENAGIAALCRGFLTMDDGKRAALSRDTHR